MYFSQTEDSLIEGNTSYGSKGSHGIYLANGGSDNTIIRGNTCYNNGHELGNGNGIHLNGDASQDGDGMHSGITIDGNVLYDNYANAMDFDGIKDSLIQNNLTWGNGRHALRAFTVDAGDSQQNLKIVNNTFIATGGNNAIKITEDEGGHTIFNNVLIAEGGGAIQVGKGPLNSNRNATAGNFSIDGGASTQSLSQWQSLGFDTNSYATTGAATFVNASGRDYHLKPGVLSINGGVSSFNGVAAPAKDQAGVARPINGSHDMGAFETN
jgi:parallel beta-helix repeat protein